MKHLGKLIDRIIDRVNVNLGWHRQLVAGVRSTRVGQVDGAREVRISCRLHSK